MFDRVTDGLKPQLVKDLGATYHHDSLPASGLHADVTIECTGVPSVIVDVMTCGGVDSITCLTGVSPVGAAIPFGVGGWNRDAVLNNDVVFGTVNANRRHYEAAAQSLLQADQSWLERLITRRVPIAEFTDAFARRPNDVKVVLEL